MLWIRDIVFLFLSHEIIDLLWSFAEETSAIVLELFSFEKENKH